MDTLVCGVPAAFQLLMPTSVVVFRSLPSAGTSNDENNAPEALKGVKKGDCVLLADRALTLEEAILAHKTDKEPVNNTGFFIFSGGSAERRHRPTPRVAA
ncbi:hypothetical protein JKF63_03808 [Porcisia hertigi]|uniref:Uncharacterized protein n=1 Tax=Porcisia hertigi TaxID=2761500 RepID=A0A836HU05_9TRYP|nr:hypothetical protein JKF63_03808 [Porcisia hertigi]